MLDAPEPALSEAEGSMSVLRILTWVCKYWGTRNSATLKLETRNSETLNFCNLAPKNLRDADHPGDSIPLNLETRASARDLYLLHGARRGREHRVRVASNHPDRAHDNH